MSQPPYPTYPVPYGVPGTPVYYPNYASLPYMQPALPPREIQPGGVLGQQIPLQQQPVARPPNTGGRGNMEQSRTLPEQARTQDIELQSIPSRSLEAFESESKRKSESNTTEYNEFVGNMNRQDDDAVSLDELVLEDTTAGDSSSVPPIEYSRIQVEGILSVFLAASNEHRKTQDTRASLKSLIDVNQKNTWSFSTRHMAAYGQCPRCMMSVQYPFMTSFAVFNDVAFTAMTSAMHEMRHLVMAGDYFGSRVLEAKQELSLLAYLYSTKDQFMDDISQLKMLFEMLVEACRHSRGMTARSVYLLHSITGSTAKRLKMIAPEGTEYSCAMYLTKQVTKCVAASNTEPSIISRMMPLLTLEPESITPEYLHVLLGVSVGEDGKFSMKLEWSEPDLVAAVRQVPWNSLDILVDVVTPTLECILSYAVEKRFIKLYTLSISLLTYILNAHPGLIGSVATTLIASTWVGIRWSVPVWCMISLGKFSMEGLAILAGMVLLIKEPLNTYCKKPMQERHTSRIEFLSYLLGKRKATADLYDTVPAIREALTNAVFPTVVLMGNIARECMMRSENHWWIARFLVEELVFIQGIFAPEQEQTLVPRAGEPDVRHPSCVTPLRSEAADILVTLCSDIPEVIGMVIYALAMHNGRLQAHIIEPMITRINFDRYKLSSQSLDLLCFLLAGRQGPRASTVANATDTEYGLAWCRAVLLTSEQRIVTPAKDSLKLAAVLIQSIKWVNLDTRLRLPALFMLVASVGLVKEDWLHVVLGSHEIGQVLIANIDRVVALHVLNNDMNTMATERVLLHLMLSIGLYRDDVRRAVQPQRLDDGMFLYDIKWLLQSRFFERMISVLPKISETAAASLIRGVFAALVGAPCACGPNVVNPGSLNTIPVYRNLQLSSVMTPTDGLVAIHSFQNCLFEYTHEMTLRNTPRNTVARLVQLTFSIGPLDPVDHDMLAMMWFSVLIALAMGEIRGTRPMMLSWACECLEVLLHGCVVNGADMSYCIDVALALNMPRSYSKKEIIGLVKANRPFCAWLLVQLHEPKFGDEVVGDDSDKVVPALSLIKEACLQATSAGSESSTHMRLGAVVLWELFAVYGGLAENRDTMRPSKMVNDMRSTLSKICNGSGSKSEQFPQSVRDSFLAGYISMSTRSMPYGGAIISKHLRSFVGLMRGVPVDSLTPCLITDDEIRSILIVWSGAPDRSDIWIRFDKPAPRTAGPVVRTPVGVARLLLAPAICDQFALFDSDSVDHTKNMARSFLSTLSRSYNYVKQNDFESLINEIKSQSAAIQHDADSLHRLDEEFCTLSSTLYSNQNSQLNVPVTCPSGQCGPVVVPTQQNQIVSSLAATRATFTSNREQAMKILEGIEKSACGIASSLCVLDLVADGVSGLPDPQQAIALGMFLLKMTLNGQLPTSVNAVNTSITQIVQSIFVQFIQSKPEYQLSILSILLGEDECYREMRGRPLRVWAASLIDPKLLLAIQHKHINKYLMALDHVLEVSQNRKDQYAEDFNSTCVSPPTPAETEAIIKTFDLATFVNNLSNETSPDNLTFIEQTVLPKLLSSESVRAIGVQVAQGIISINFPSHVLGIINGVVPFLKNPVSGFTLGDLVQNIDWAYVPGDVCFEIIRICAATVPIAKIYQADLLNLVKDCLSNASTSAVFVEENKDVYRRTKLGVGEEGPRVTKTSSPIYNTVDGIMKSCSTDSDTVIRVLELCSTVVKIAPGSFNRVWYTLTEFVIPAILSRLSDPLDIARLTSMPDYVKLHSFVADAPWSHATFYLYEPQGLPSIVRAVVACPALLPLVTSTVDIMNFMNVLQFNLNKNNATNYDRTFNGTYIACVVQYLTMCWCLLPSSIPDTLSSKLFALVPRLSDDNTVTTNAEPLVSWSLTNPNALAALFNGNTLQGYISTGIGKAQMHSRLIDTISLLIYICQSMPNASVAIDAVAAEIRSLMFTVWNHSRNKFSMFNFGVRDHVTFVAQGLLAITINLTPTTSTSVDTTDLPKCDLRVVRRQLPQDAISCIISLLQIDNIETFTITPTTFNVGAGANDSLLFANSRVPISEDKNEIEELKSKIIGLVCRFASSLYPTPALGVLRSITESICQKPQASMTVLLSVAEECVRACHSEECASSTAAEMSAVCDKCPLDLKLAILDACTTSQSYPLVFAVVGSSVIKTSFDKHVLVITKMCKLTPPTHREFDIFAPWMLACRIYDDERCDAKDNNMTKLFTKYLSNYIVDVSKIKKAQPKKFVSLDEGGGMHGGRVHIVARTVKILVEYSLHRIKMDKAGKSERLPSSLTSQVEEMNGLQQYPPFDVSPYSDFITDVARNSFSPVFTLSHFGEAVHNLTPQASYLQPHLM